METFELLKSAEATIFEEAKMLLLDQSQINISPPEIYRSYCTDQTKKINYYNQQFNTYLLKQNSVVNKKIVKSENLSKILSMDTILNVFYFEVWGDVLEHRDPPGYHLGYPSNNYKTIIMPIEIPSSDKNIFDTFYNKNSFNLIEGKFFIWDVCNIPHSWKFDYSKVNKFFKLLHIDFI